MKRKITWPNGHDFAFTIVDDTDNATIDNIKPVYDYLLSRGIKTTKTTWVYPPRDNIYKGQCIEDSDYLAFLKYIQKKGFEIAFHNAGSGSFTRDETLKALESFKSAFNEYPIVQINHNNNYENIYWGKDRFSSIFVKMIYQMLNPNINSFGAVPKSNYFWGDFAKKNIKYIRNRTFNDTNTLKADYRLVYKETKKEDYSNYWFSSSDGMTLSSFLKLLTRKKVDKLIKEKGCCVVYTHFAYDFVNDNGELNEDFKKIIDYISSKNGWFVPASELLDFVLSCRDYKPSKLYEIRKDIKWLFERVTK